MAALRTASETPERLWSAGMASALGEELAHLTAQARAAQVRAIELDPEAAPGTLSRY